MSIPKKVTNYLDKSLIKYEVVPHRKIFTAHDLAQTLREDFRKIAKTLLVKADKDYAIVVIPAHYNLDLKKLKTALKVKKVELPKEEIMIKVFKVKLGGLTPFGALHKVETWVDKSFLKAEKMIVNAGSFTESLRLKSKDFVKLEEAKLGSFVKPSGYKIQKPKKAKTVKKTKKRKK